MMNSNFPNVKTYSTKWQRSYKLYHEKEGVFDRVQAQTQKTAGHRDDAKRDALVKTVENGSPQRPASMNSAKRQPTQKSLKRICRSEACTPSSSRNSSRPITLMSRPPTVTLMSRPPTITSVSRAATIMAVSRPSVSNRVVHSKFPAGTPLIQRQVRKHAAVISRKAPVTRQAAAARTHTSAAPADPTHSPPKVLCTETLLRYHPEHAEKAYCKNDSYIQAWLRGVEEATERGGQPSNDSESSIELLRDSQVEHSGLTRRDSASCLLKEMMNAFKSSSMEKSSELSVVKELPSLPEQPSGSQNIKAVSSEESKQTRQKLMKSRIPIRRLSRCSSQSVKESDFQPTLSTPTVTHTAERLYSAITHEDSSHTYTYRWTTATPTKEGDMVTQDTQTRSMSSAGCIGRLTRKKLNSTTKSNAMSLGKVDFSQNLSPILSGGSATTTKTVTGYHSEASERRRLAETTPEKRWERNCPNKENVCAIPRKQRYVSRNRKGSLDPKTSTALFVTEIKSCNSTPNLSPIQAEREPRGRVPQPTFDFHDVEQDLAVKEKEANQADLSSVAPPSVGEDELLPLRISGDVVNSDEIVCASDVSQEVDIPNVKAADGDVPDSSPPTVEVTTSYGSATVATHTTTKPHTKARQAVKLKPASHSPQTTRTSQQIGGTAPKKSTVSGKPTRYMDKQLCQATPSFSGVYASHGNSTVSNTKSLKSWMYFPGCSSGSNFNGKSQKAAAQVTHTHPPQHPLCNLVRVVKNCQMARAAGKVKVMSKSGKLMVAIAQAPPDAIRATVGRVTKYSTMRRVTLV